MKIENMMRVPALAEYNRTPARNLAPPALRKVLPTLAEFTAAQAKDPVFHARFFKPTGRDVTWYVAAGNPDTKQVSKFDDDYIFFGLVVDSAYCPQGEWGTFSLRELEAVHVGFMLGVERDVYFAPTSYSAVTGKTLADEP